MLPKITHPTHSFKIPSTGKVVRFHPFTVREEKILLMAQQSSTVDDILAAYVQLVKSCVVDDIDVYKLTSFDLEMFFVQLRSKSVSNIIEASVEDDSELDEKTQKPKKVKIKIDLEKVTLTRELAENEQKKVMLNDDVGVVLRYPSFRAVQEADSLREKGDVAGAAFSLYRSCIDVIFDKDNVYSSSDITALELEEWMSDIPAAKMGEIAAFLEDMPKVCYRGSYQRADGTTRAVYVEGLESFFA